MAEKSRTLNKKDIASGYSLTLFKYWTNHPKNIIPKCMQGSWNPKFDGSYEMVIKLYKRDGYDRENTHPKISWYLGKDNFKKLFEKIESPEDFYIVNKQLNECLIEGINYTGITKKVEGLLSKL